MINVTEPLRGTMRLFDRHERALSYLLHILILLVCLHTGLVNATVWYVIPVFVLMAVFHTRLLWMFHRKFGDHRVPVPLLLVDAALAGICITLTEFSAVPTLTFVGMLMLAMVGIGSVIIWIIVLLGCLATVFAVSALLGYQGESLNESPVIPSVVSFMGLMTMVLIEVIQSRQRVNNAVLQVEEIQNKNTQLMNIANKIARYAPSQVWQSIVRGDRDARIENKRKKLTIFFSDIQGFTELSETLLPDDLAVILNTYFEHMSDLAKKYGGTIDKFIGDALLIFFGDPTTQGAKNDAIACVEMAIAMRRENKLLRQKWKALGFDGLHVRMGITTGYCHVGNFGSNSRMSYTIIGRDANLAARLQTAADPDEILISNDTYLLIRDRISCRERGTLQLKGIAKPMQTWQVLDKFEDTQTYSRRWVEYELDGFNLQLDMDEVKSYDRDRILQALQQVARNIDQQQPGEGRRPPDQS